MNTVIRRSISTAAGVATLAGTGLALCAPTAQAATSPFTATTSTRVPTGWTAVETGNLAQPSSPNLVYAVSASGAQKLVLRLPHNENVSAVSGDGRRVSVLALGAKGSIVKVYDLSTHRVSTLPTHANATLFTNPRGLAMYAWSSADTGRVVRIDLKGRVQARFPGISMPTVVSSPNGQLVWGATNGRVTLNDNATGRVLRTYAVPKGYDRCYPTHAWNATAVAGACWGTGDSGPQTFLFNTSGHVSGPVTRVLSGKAGYMDAWNSPAGLVAVRSSVSKVPGAVLKTGSAVRQLPVFTVADVRGNVLLGETPATSPSHPEAFVSVNLSSMKVQRLLLPAAGRDILATVTNDASLGMAQIGD